MGLIDILIRARSQGAGEVQKMSQQLSMLDRAAGAAANGLAGLAAGAAVAGLYQLAQAMDEVARRGAVFEQLGDVLGDFAVSVNSSADAMVSAAKKAAQGTISEFELILNANRAIQFEVAKTPEQFAKLIELSTALGRAQGIADTQALEFITTGLARESRLILDNLGLIIDIDKATAVYAATIGKTAEQLTQAERKAALLDEAFRQGATAIQANRDAADSAATQYERLDANTQNLTDNIGILLATAASGAVGGFADTVGVAADAVADATIRAQQSQAEGEARGLENVISGLEQGLARIKSDLASARDDGDLARSAALTSDLARQNNLLSDAIKLLADATGRQGVVLAATGIEAAQYAEAMGLAADANYQAALAAASASANYDPLNIATNSLANDTAILNEALSGTPGWMRGVARASVEAGNSILQTAQSVVILKGQLADLESVGAGARNTIINSAAGVADVVGDARAVALAKEQIGQLDFAVGALKQQLKDGTLSQIEFDYQLARLGDSVTDTFDGIKDADAAAKRFAAQGLTGMSNAASEAQQAFDELQSKVAGVLGASLDPGVGVDVDSILPRADSVNEDARRLADVAVNGFDSPWADYLSNKFPDLFGEAFSGADIKTEAAKVLRDFQDGLTPQLLDADAAKERVRRMLIGEAKMAELAKEIAGELAAEFGGLDQSTILSTAQNALGVGGVLAPPDTSQIASQYGAAGSGASVAFSDGVRASVIDGNLGGQVTAALDEQLRAESNLQRLAEGGRISGSAWGGGFLETVQSGVPSALVELLASLVTPAVDALQRQNTSLQGAR
jgi:hypothetical protein